VDNAVAAGSFSNKGSYCIKDLFDRFLTSESIFIDRDMLSSAFIPDFLPHREKEMSDIESYLASPVLARPRPPSWLEGR